MIVLSLGASLPFYSAPLLNTTYGCHGNTLEELESWGQAAEIPHLVNNAAIWRENAGHLSEFVRSCRHQRKVESVTGVTGTEESRDGWCRKDGTLQMFWLGPHWSDRSGLSSHKPNSLISYVQNSSSWGWRLKWCYISCRMHNKEVISSSHLIRFGPVGLKRLKKHGSQLSFCRMCNNYHKSSNCEQVSHVVLCLKLYLALSLIALWSH